MFANATKDAVTADIKNGASALGNDVRQTATRIRDDLKQTNLEETAHEIGQKMHDYVDCASHEINDVSNSITSQIRANPVGSSLVALALGFLVGSALRR